MISFKAHCAKGHDRIDFTEPAAFEAHMGTEHKAQKLYAGKPAYAYTDRGHEKVGAPGWRGGKISAPYEWKAPRPERNGLEKVAQRIANGEYVWPLDGRTYGHPAAEATEAA